MHFSFLIRPSQDKRLQASLDPGSALRKIFPNAVITSDHNPALTMILAETGNPIEVLCIRRKTIIGHETDVPGVIAIGLYKAIKTCCKNR